MKQDGPERYLQKQGAIACQDGWQIGYDRAWTQTEDNPEYYLCVIPEESELPYLWQVRVIVSQEDGKTLFEIPVSGQEGQR